MSAITIENINVPVRPSKGNWCSKSVKDTAKETVRIATKLMFGGAAGILNCTLNQVAKGGRSFSALREGDGDYVLLKKMIEEMPIPISMDTMKLIVGVPIPIVEEIPFRERIQSQLLKWATHSLLERVGKKDWIDSKLEKAVRIVATAVLFGLYHLDNRDKLSEKHLRGQVINTFVMGLVFGVIRESSLGLTGAIGAHCANNLFALSGAFR